MRTAFLPILGLVAVLFAAPVEAKPKAAKARANPMPAGLCPFDPAVANFSGELKADAAAIFREIETRYGACEAAVWLGKGAITLRHRHAQIPLQLRTGRKNVIQSFILRAPRFPDDSFEKIKAHVASLGGSLELRDAKGDAIHAVDPDRLLAIGDARRLFLAAALQDDLQRGKYSLATVVPITARPAHTGPGFLKDWPAGMGITVDTLRTLMLLERDAGASDLLLQLLGRDHRGLEMANDLPFLSWREYVLLMRAPQPLAEDFRRQPKRVLEQLRDTGERLSLPPYRTERADRVGWFASTHRLCELLATLPDDPRLAMNGVFGDTVRGVLSSGPGVAQLTLREPGIASCLSITLNGSGRHDTALNQELAARVLALLGKVTEENPQSDSEEDR